jgi:hypothetical protein
MEESNQQPLEGEWESPLKKLWDVLMFRILILPVLLKVLNLLVLLYAILMTVVYISGTLIFAIPVIWVYVIILRVASEITLLGYNFLVQRTQQK